GGGERTVNQQCILAPRRRYRRRQRRLEIGAECAERVRFEREARRHGMATTLEDQPAADGFADGAAELDAGDRAARPAADASRLERNGKSRSREPLLEP